MADTTDFVIGTEVRCSDSDSDCGQLQRVVIDPVARALTHLVVEPKHRPGTGHLVPIDLADVVAGDIQLRCTTEEFDALDDAEDTQFLPGADGAFNYEQDQMLTWPYYALGSGGIGMGGMGMGGVGLGMGGMDLGPRAITHDRVPTGQIQVRRGEHVHATDGEIGKVQGLVVDPSDHHVTHVLLDEGHLWGAKTVAIPIAAVTTIVDGVRLSLSKDQVRDLPGLDIDH
jgi:sporulation protein YlmC with PRC-barrel domain